MYYFWVSRVPANLREELRPLSFTVPSPDMRHHPPTRRPVNPFALYTSPTCIEDDHPLIRYNVFGRRVVHFPDRLRHRSLLSINNNEADIQLWRAWMTCRHFSMLYNRRQHEQEQLILNHCPRHTHGTVLATLRHVASRSRYRRPNTARRTGTPIKSLREEWDRSPSWRRMKNTCE